jgi:hypothetical protein
MAAIMTARRDDQEDRGARRRGIAGCDSIRIAAHLRRASKGVAHRRSYCVGEVGAERSTPDVQIENFGEGDLTENQRKEACYAQKQLADSFFFAACLLIGFGAAYPGDGARRLVRHFVSTFP